MWVYLDLVVVGVFVGGDCVIGDGGYGDFVCGW